MAAADDLALPPSCAPRYHALQLLGQGGFGRVVLARQTELKRIVVIKVLHESLAGAEDVTRFQQEARITATLKHDNIVRLLDHGVDEGRPWIAYEYVAGDTLSDLIQRGPLAVPDLLSCALQVFAGLAEAHAQGIVHRDIKPANVLRSVEGQIKLADFGAATWGAADRVQTKAGMILGTPIYLAPEVISGEAAGPASDVYSTGVMLFELATGRPPFSTESLPGILAAHLRQAPPDPLELRPELPRALARVILACLEKRPADRPADARAAHDEVRALTLRTPDVERPRIASRPSVTRVASAPDRTRVVTAPDRARATSRARHAAPVALALGAAVALVVAALWSLRPGRLDYGPPLPSPSATVPAAPAPAPRVSLPIEERVDAAVRLVNGNRRARRDRQIALLSSIFLRHEPQDAAECERLMADVRADRATLEQLNRETDQARAQAGPLRSRLLRAHLDGALLAASMSARVGEAELAGAQKGVGSAIIEGAYETLTGLRVYTADEERLVVRWLDQASELLEALQSGPPERLRAVPLLEDVVALARVLSGFKFEAGAEKHFEEYERHLLDRWNGLSMPDVRNAACSGWRAGRTKQRVHAMQLRGALERLAIAWPEARDAVAPLVAEARAIEAADTGRRR